MKTSRYIVFVAAVAGAAACEQKSTAQHGDAGSLSEKPALDPSLAKAVAAASSPSKTDKTGAANAGGPPPNGVFTDGQADKELPPGAPVKITVGSEGSEPRVRIANLQPKPGTRRSAILQFQLSTGPGQGLPPIQLWLAFQVQKGTSGGAPAKSPADEQAVEQVPVTVTISNPKVIEGGSAARELSAQIETLKGSRIEYVVDKNGAGNEFRYTLPKNAEPGLDQILAAVTETVSTSLVPFPDKALGSGAYFMAVTREHSGGGSVIAYRLVKITDVKDDKLTVSVNTKRYAASDQFAMPGLPQDMGKLTLAEFASTTEGTLQIASGSPFPKRSELTQTLNVQLKPEKRPDQRLELQQQARSVLSFDAANGSSK